MVLDGYHREVQTGHLLAQLREKKKKKTVYSSN